MLSDEELLRYSAQLLMPEFDVEGQTRLKQSSVAIVGLGGLGCPVAMYLAAAGVGHLILVDGDRVELSNLQRQIAHATDDIGEYKVHSAQQSIGRINPEIEISTVAQHLEQETMAELVEQVDLVVDCTDNFATRYALNRACIAGATPLVSAAAIRCEGQLSVFDPVRGGPCYRCLYPSESEQLNLSCSESGVLSPVVGILGSMQALEAIKVISGYGSALRGQIMLLDLKTMDVQKLKLSAKKDCPDCGHIQP